jgi:hypothetical protein
VIVQFWGATACQLAEIYRLMQAMSQDSEEILAHDNACPHVANTIKTKMQHTWWEVMQHPATPTSLGP